ncbi:MAG: response regulator, partial [Muribaculaceae bacterium]|nr:response regulator [Muribaculaceae bacterium]
MSSLRCIVVDDEPLACRLIASYVERTEGLELCGSFTSAMQALDAINSLKPDIAFLDIQMPELTGLDIARRITAQTKIVFTTAYRDFAVEGFQVNAIHYLLKPISYAEFLQAVERAGGGRNDQQQFISVKSEYRLIRIPVNDILYVEGLKDYIKIYIDGQPR